MLSCQVFRDSLSAMRPTPLGQSARSINVELDEDDLSIPLGSPEFKKTRRRLQDAVDVNKLPKQGLSSNRLMGHEGFPARQKLPEPFQMKDVLPDPRYVQPEMVGMAEELRMSIQTYHSELVGPSEASIPLVEATNVFTRDRQIGKFIINCDSRSCHGKADPLIDTETHE